MSWKKQLALDLRALGSLPFYGIVYVRSLIGDYPEFQAQLIIGIIIFYGLNLIFENSDGYAGRAILLFIFISLFYNSTMFTIFILIILILLCFSQHYLKVKRNLILQGLFCGFISAAIAYYLVSTWMP